jgi:hypothetical protein
MFIGGGDGLHVLVELVHEYELSMLNVDSGLGVTHSPFCIDAIKFQLYVVVPMVIVKL